MNKYLSSHAISLFVRKLFSLLIAAIAFVCLLLVKISLIKELWSLHRIENWSLHSLSFVIRIPRFWFNIKPQPISAQSSLITSFVLQLQSQQAGTDWLDSSKLFLFTWLSCPNFVVSVWVWSFTWAPAYVTAASAIPEWCIFSNFSSSTTENYCQILYKNLYFIERINLYYKTEQHILWLKVPKVPKLEFLRH